MNDLQIIKFKILKWSFILACLIQNFKIKGQFKILEIGKSPVFCTYFRSYVTNGQN